MSPQQTQVFQNSPVVPQTTKPAVVIGKVELKPRTEKKGSIDKRTRGGSRDSKVGHGTHKAQKVQAKAEPQKKYSLDPKVANQQVFQELQYVKKQLANEKAGRAAADKQASDFGVKLSETRSVLLALYQAVSDTQTGVDAEDGTVETADQFIPFEILAKTREILGINTGV